MCRYHCPAWVAVCQWVSVVCVCHCRACATVVRASLSCVCPCPACHALVTVLLGSHCPAWVANVHMSLSCLSWLGRCPTWVTGVSCVCHCRARGTNALKVASQNRLGASALSISTDLGHKMWKLRTEALRRWCQEQTNPSRTEGRSTVV